MLSLTLWDCGVRPDPVDETDTVTEVQMVASFEGPCGQCYRLMEVGVLLKNVGVG